MSRIALGLALVAMVAGCGADPELREDIESEAPAGTATVPPTRATPSPAASGRAIPAGTVLTFEVLEDVSTSSNSEGDGFSLRLVDSASGKSGALLPAGTLARGVVTGAHKSTGPQDQALLAVRITSIEAAGSQKPIQGEVQSAAIESSNRDSKARTVATIATGAAAGAIIGQVLGRDTRGMVTGAAVGTAVGVGVALTTRGGDATLTRGSRIVLRLLQDLVL